MTNIFKSPGKLQGRDALLQAGFSALSKEGWKVEKVPGVGKSSVRRIVKGKLTRLISIKTTQDTWLAFSRTPDDKAWSTLDDVEAVLVVSVDDRDDPKYAQVHFMEADDLRQRFDRAYAARKAAGHVIPVGRGVWISLYEPESSDPVNLIGAGAGLDSPIIQRVSLFAASAEAPLLETVEIDLPLTIPEAKRRLATTLGVDVSAIKISVEA